MRIERFQIIEFEVPSSGATVKTSTNNELDKNYDSLHGISLELNSTETALRASTLGLSVDNIEISTNEFPAGKFYGNFGVEQNKRWFFPEFPINPNGGRADMTFTDGGNSATYPYKVKMVFWLKNPIKQE